MMAQNDLVVAGIDVAKDKVDVCIRSLSLKRTFATTAEGRRELASWLRRQKVGNAVIEASGGFVPDGADVQPQSANHHQVSYSKRLPLLARSRRHLAH